VTTLVDTNVLLDLVTADPQWMAWSDRQLTAAAARGPVAINPIIFAELSLAFDSIEAMDEALAEFAKLTLPYTAGFLAGRCYERYRRAGGRRRSPLPDFYIGAHAAVERHTLLTRDQGRYRSYFPNLEIIAPDGE